MSPETRLILDRIEASDRSVHARISEVKRDIEAELSSLKKDHTALATDVTKLVAAESALTKYYGRVIRLRDLLIASGTAGAIYGVAHVTHLISF